MGQKQVLRIGSVYHNSCDLHRCDLHFMAAKAQKAAGKPNSLPDKAWIGIDNGTLPHISFVRQTDNKLVEAYEHGQKH